ncbi:MAG: NC domain protein [Pelotomaculum sp. PtaU1.Bin035]|nr:MAG: NC domain protein [Pelotomaculum sp. PtaU1.Bin035]
MGFWKFVACVAGGAAAIAAAPLILPAAAAVGAVAATAGTAAVAAGTAVVGTAAAAAGTTTTAAVVAGAAAAAKANLSSKAQPRKTHAEYGDVIGVKRYYKKLLPFYHYAIYVNDISVIHYTSLNSDVSGENKIMETDMKHFLRGEKSYFVIKFGKTSNDRTVYNVNAGACVSSFNLHKKLLDSLHELKYNLYSPSETVQRARNRLGEADYDLFGNNCEHFAIWCKTGMHRSYQVERRPIDSKLDEFINILERVNIYT